MDSQRKMQREITALKDRIIEVAEEKDAEIERLRERVSGEQERYLALKGAHDLTGSSK
jgi:hypothetical protein